jgi:hypothetical protein
MAVAGGISSANWKWSGLISIWEPVGSEKLLEADHFNSAFRSDLGQ